MQQIHPENLVAPSFVYVDAVVLNMIFLSYLCAQRLDQFVVHAVRKIIGGKFVAHQSLTGKRKMQGAAPSIPSPQKRSVVRRSIFITWRLMMTLKLTMRHLYQNSCISTPCWLTRLQNMILKPSWRWKSGLISVRNHFCARSTLVPRETLFLWIPISLYFQARHVILMVFLLTWHHPVLP